MKAKTVGGQRLLDNRETIERLGWFQVVWASFEQTIEIAIGKELNIDAERTNIVCAGLQFSAKASILKALITHGYAANDPRRALINKIITEAKRNKFMHGVITTADDSISFHAREVKDSFRSSEIIFGPGDMARHVSHISKLNTELQTVYGIDGTDFSAHNTAMRSLSNKSSMSPKLPPAKASE